MHFKQELNMKSLHKNIRRTEHKDIEEKQGLRRLSRFFSVFMPPGTIKGVSGSNNHAAEHGGLRRLSRFFYG
jgi:hypothetical protein